MDYAPFLVGSDPGIPYRGAFNALGAPDYADPTGAAPCADQASCTWVTLGDGGSLTLRFVDNLLTAISTRPLAVDPPHESVATDSEGHAGFHQLSSAMLLMRRQVAENPLLPSTSTPRRK